MLFQDTSNGVLLIRYADPGCPLSYREFSVSQMPDCCCLTHWFEDLTLLQTMSPGITVRVHDEEMHLEAGEILFVNTKQLQSIWGTERGQGCRLLLFHPRILGEAAQLDPLPSRLLADEGLRCLRFAADSPAGLRLRDLLDRARVVCDPGRGCYRLEAMDLAAQVMLELCGAYREGREPIPAAERKNSASIRTMLAAVTTDYAKKISLETLAKLGGVSRSKCCKLFAQYVGRSPMDYLCCYRLQTAWELLLTTDLPIQDLAKRCGFPEQSYFTRLFKARYGITPGQCRKRSG